MFKSKSWDFLLVQKTILVNFIAFILLSLITYKGWLLILVTIDFTGITQSIMLLFLAGLIFTWYKIYQVSKDLNKVKKNFDTSEWNSEKYQNISNEYFSEIIKLRYFSKISVIRYIGSLLVLLGLIGTVVGFIVIFGGITPDAVGSLTNVSKLLASLSQGMGVALYTTLVGSVLNIWLMVNNQILTTGVYKLIYHILEKRKCS